MRRAQLSLFTLSLILLAFYRLSYTSHQIGSENLDLNYKINLHLYFHIILVTSLWLTVYWDCKEKLFFWSLSVEKALSKVAKPGSFFQGAYLVFVAVV